MEQTKVLLIDADESSRNFLAQMLHKNHYVVLHAGTGREGVQKVAEDLPDLVIFDTNLPDLLAKELLGQLQQNPLTAHIPCVVLSGQSTPEEMQACFQAGCAEYYVKSGMVMVTMVNAIPKILVERKNTSPEQKNGLLIVFLGVSGGLGVSSLCANISMNIAHHLHPSTVAVVDMVLPMGTLSQIMGGDDTAFNIIKISEQPEQTYTPEYLKEHLTVPPQWLVHLLPGSPDPETSNHLAAERIPALIAALKKTYDFTIMDIGRALSRISLPIIHEADLIVLVLGTNLSTISLTRKAWDYLLKQGITKEKLFPILNRAVGLEGITKSEAEKLLGFEIQLTIPYMMENFALANNQHIPLSVKLPNDTVSMQLKQGAIEMSKQAIRVQVR